MATSWKVGQVWRENDNRYYREIEILGVPKKDVKSNKITFVAPKKTQPISEVFVKTVAKKKNGKVMSVGKVTAINPSRLNGKAGGYSYIRG
jgi:hypothetical protein